MNRDPNTSNERRLVYREGPYLLFGLPLAVLGLAAIYGTGTKLLSSWPDDPVALFGGLVFSALILGVGVRFLICRNVVLDKVARQIIRSSTFLFWRRLITKPLSDFTSVSWKPLRDCGDTKYVVQLLAPGEDVALFEVLRMDDARRITREMGEFLDLKEEHWDKALLKAERKQPELRRAEAKTRVIRSLVGRQPMRCVFRSESRLVYAQSFETFLKIFAWLSGTMGLLFLLSPWLGVKVGGMEDAPWSPVVVGAIFLILAEIFLLGRRGFTIDRQERVASSWWGVVVPISVTRRELSAFSAVGLERSVEEEPEQPYAISRVMLVGHSGQQLIVFKSIDTEESRSVAEEIAEFLNYPIVETLPNQTLNPTGNRPAS